MSTVPNLGLQTICVIHFINISMWQPLTLIWYVCGMLYLLNFNQKQVGSIQLLVAFLPVHSMHVVESTSGANPVMHPSVLPESWIF